jgi:hypothetical protein
VNVTEPRGDRLGTAEDVVALRNIDHHAGRCNAGGDQVRLYARERGGIDVEERKVRALARKSECHGAADSAGSARDDRGLPAQVEQRVRPGRARARRLRPC